MVHLKRGSEHGLHREKALGARPGAYGLMFLAFAYFRNVYVAAM